MISINNNYPTLLLNFDLNDTIICEKSSSGAGREEKLISILAENTFFDWEDNGVVMSFKDYVYHLLPGEKSDRTLKTIRMKKIANFLTWLEEKDHLLKEQVNANYREIKAKLKFTESGTLVFNSFFILLEKLRTLNIHFIIQLRTFGKHLDGVIKAIEDHPSGVKFKHRGNFSSQVLSLKGEESLDKIGQIFQRFLVSQGENFALQDDWETWNRDKERGRSGKAFIYDSKDVYHLSLFFDDNITGGEFDIVNPIDISGTDLSGKELLDRILFKVNTVEAIKNDEYFFHLVQKALKANGYV